MRRLAVLLCAISVLAVVGAALPPYPPPDIVGRVTAVIDGDTIDVLLQNVPEALAEELTEGEVVRVRYIGVNARELGEEQGMVATELNRILVEGRTVYIELDKTHWDMHGRLLAYVYLDSRGFLMVNAILSEVMIVEPMAFKSTPRYNSLFSCLHGCWAHGPCYSWDEAAEHYNEQAWVYGPVVDTARLFPPKNHVFLNIGYDYPNPKRFTVVIFGEYTRLFDAFFDTYFEKQLEGKIIYVFGWIKEYKQEDPEAVVPEIVLTTPRHLLTECPTDCGCSEE